jgi:hypothetical protein
MSASTDATKQLELIYFNGAGKGELVRLVLHCGEYPFTDSRISLAECAAMKADPTSPVGSRFKQAPVIVHHGMILAQSNACTL